MLIFSNYFRTIFHGPLNHEKKRNWSNLLLGFLVHFLDNGLDNLEYCNRFWRRISFFFFCLLCKRIRCLILESIFFQNFKNSAVFMKFI